MNKIFVKENSYFDSVTLMSLGAKLAKKKGVQQATVLMGTQMNKEMIASVGFSERDIEKVTENDLVIAVMGDNESICDETIGEAIEALNSSKKKNKKGDKIYKTISSAYEDNKDANMVVISVPGQFAFKEAKAALDNNMHVMLFSDNVSIEEEKALKLMGLEKGLLVMGPDCGTSIINGVGLCFANKIRKGDIGIVAASGTGLQEVSVIIDRLGGGVSQAIGTGGRDLHESIGGLMMIEGIKTLAKDPSTEVIVLVSKPPAKAVKDKVLDEVRRVSKPVVICFIDHKEEGHSEGIYFGESLSDTAHKAVLVSRKEKIVPFNKISKDYEKAIKESKNRLNAKQKYIRGLFCGGTLCAESLSILREYVDEIYSNVAKKEKEKLKDISKPEKHTLLDLGDDFFTNGKPHPMIEPKIRLDKILEESEDPEVGVILLDFELGFGSSEDPVGVTIDTIQEAEKRAKKSGRELIFVTYVCGTKGDYQMLENQEKILRDNGVIVATTNAEASYIAASIIKGEMVQ